MIYTFSNLHLPRHHRRGFLLLKKGVSGNIHCNRHQLSILNNRTDSGEFFFSFRVRLLSPAPPQFTEKQGVRLYTSLPPRPFRRHKCTWERVRERETHTFFCINLQAIYVWHRQIAGKPIIYYFFFSCL